MNHKLAFAFFAALPVPAHGCADTVELVVGGPRDAVDVPATQTLLREPFGTAFDAKGTAWIVEMASGNRLLHIKENGTLRQVAGREAQFDGPHNLAVLPSDEVLIGDTWNGKVRCVQPRTGQISDVEGWSVPKEKAPRRFRVPTR